MRNNIPNYGLCPCGYPYDEDGICTNPDCPNKAAYEAGYRANILTESYPIDDLD